MKIWKIVLIAVGAIVAVMLAYPGIPAGASLESNMSTRYAMLTCSYLHWTGLRFKKIDMRHEIKDGGISMSNGPCYTWANWDPKSS